MQIDTLKTPCAVVDLDVVERNTERMAQRAHTFGVQLRPHVKTHKCVEAARLQIRDHFGGITVSTLAEAKFFADAGFDDITYAVPLAPARVDDATALRTRVKTLNVLVDHPDAVAAIVASGASHDVLVKVDCGYHRAGVDPESDAALALVESIVAAERLRFAGVLTHAGHSYACRGREAIAAVAKQERDVIVAFAARLRDRGIDVPTVSAGSTPTAAIGDDFSGVTELRPGNYAFFDAFQASIGSCSLEDAAFSVLASAIGVYPEQGRLVTDAGALALSKDRGAGEGFGVIRDQPLRVASLSQEHGVVRGEAEAIANWGIGDRFRIVANHSCLAAACHDRYHVVRGDEVVDTWRPARGWDAG